MQIFIQILKGLEWLYNIASGKALRRKDTSSFYIHRVSTLIVYFGGWIWIFPIIYYFWPSDPCSFSSHKELELISPVPSACRRVKVKIQSVDPICDTLACRAVRGWDDADAVGMRVPLIYNFDDIQYIRRTPRGGQLFHSATRRGNDYIVYMGGDWLWIDEGAKRVVSYDCIMDESRQKIHHCEVVLSNEPD